MKNAQFLGALSLLAFVCLTGPASARDGQAPEVLLSVAANDIEITDLDVTHLEIGDAETVRSDDGKTIDVLRNANGYEIYIDGELLADTAALAGDTGSTAETGREKQIEVQVVCAKSATDCGEQLHAGEYGNETGLESGYRKLVVIKRDDGESGAENAGAENDGPEQTHRVVIIRKSSQQEDGS